MTRILKAGAIYFGLVFGAGFVLGPIRILYVVPRVGVRAAELLEAPIMLVVIVLAARRVTRRLAPPRTAGSLLAVGVTALALLLSVELTLVLWLRGLTLELYLAGRDLVAGTAYAVMLGLFAAMPWLAGRLAGGADGPGTRDDGGRGAGV